MTDVTHIEAIHYETNKPVNIEIANGYIVKISVSDHPAGPDGLFVAPGFIDNQINGYRGVDFSGPGLTIDAMRRAVEAIRHDGVTSFQPTVITNSHRNLLERFSSLAALLRDSDISQSIPGFHLEGPYISPETGFYGCHPVDFIRKPSWKEFSEYLEAAEGNIRQVTVAPELDGAIEFIRLCSENNITVAIGHTNATAEQIRKAVDSGASVSTHLGNGCANLIDRHKNPL